MKDLNVAGAVIIGLGLAIAYGLTQVILSSYQGRKAAPQMTQAAPPARPLKANEPNPQPQVIAPAAPAPPVAPEPAPEAPSAPPVKTQTAPAQAAPTQPNLATAREALSYVGIDADAEEYWYRTINDPGLSANERQNLIEDLNEDGFADPRNPTLDELPLIVSRLLLIEDVAGDAMDQVNADAFQEAYKDLVNMYQALTRQPWGSQ